MMHITKLIASAAVVACLFVITSAQAPVNGEAKAPAQRAPTERLAVTYLARGDDGQPKRLIPSPKDQPKDQPEDGQPKQRAEPAPPESRLALQAATVDSKGPGIEIVPDKISIPSNKRFQIVTVKTDGKVKWMVFNKGKEPVEWLQLPGTKSIQVFPTYGVDDEIIVYAYTSVAGEPTDPVKSVIAVGKEDKKPPAQGDVENPDDKKVGPSGLHFTIITDDALIKSNPVLAALITNKDLKSGVDNRGHKLWVMDQKRDVDRIKQRGFDDYVRRIGKIPLYVIQDQAGAVVDSGPLPNSLVAVLQKLDAIVPRKQPED